MVRKQERSPRLGVSVNPSFYEALRIESRRSGMPISQMVRAALEGYMRARGYDVDADVVWGGLKRVEQDDAEGQRVAVA